MRGAAETQMGRMYDDTFLHSQPDGQSEREEQASVQYPAW